jgi:hypothetical protein
MAILKNAQFAKFYPAEFWLGDRLLATVAVPFESSLHG